MTWVEFALARQLLAEERIGTAIRAAEAEEDSDFAATAAAIERGSSRGPG